MQSFLGRVWEWLRSDSLAPLVTLEVAVVGLIVSWLLGAPGSRRFSVANLGDCMLDKSASAYPSSPVL